MGAAATATDSKSSNSNAGIRTAVIIVGIVCIVVLVGMLRGERTAKRQCVVQGQGLSSSSSSSSSASSSVAPMDAVMGEAAPGIGESKADSPGFVSPLSQLDPKKLSIRGSAGKRGSSWCLRAVKTTWKGTKTIWSSVYNQMYETKVREQ